MPKKEDREDESMLDSPQKKLQKTSHPSTVSNNQTRSTSLNTNNDDNSMEDDDEVLENVICVTLKTSLSRTQSMETSIHFASSSTIKSCETVLGSQTVYEWLAKNATLLVPPNTSSVTVDQNFIASCSCRFVYKNEKLMALSYKNSKLWERAKDNPQDLKLIIDFPVASSLPRLEFIVDYMNYYNKTGNENFRTKKFKEAIDDYTKALKRYPANMKPLCNRALCYFRNGEYVKSIQDANAFFTKMDTLKKEQKSQHESLIPKAYFRRGRALYALSNLLDRKLKGLSNTAALDLEMENFVSERENLVQFIDEFSPALSPVERSDLIIFDPAFNSLSPLLAHKLTLLQLVIRDFLQVPAEFDDYVKNMQKKNADSSFEFDIAMWNLLHNAPSKLKICPVSRRGQSATDSFLETTVIPAEWNLVDTVNQTTSKKLKVLLKSTDKYGRIARYESTFKNEILEAFCYNESDEFKRQSVLNIDQAASSWCSFVLSWVLFKRLLSFPNFDTLIGSASSDNYIYFMKLRRYLLLQFEAANTSDPLQEKIYPIRFSVYVRPSNDHISNSNQVIFDELYNESTLLIEKIKIGNNLFILAGKHETLSFYNCNKGLISHGKDATIERVVDESRLPQAVLESFL